MSIWQCITILRWLPETEKEIYYVIHRHHHHVNGIRFFVFRFIDETNWNAAVVCVRLFPVFPWSTIEMNFALPNVAHQSNAIINCIFVDDRITKLVPKMNVLHLQLDREHIHLFCRTRHLTVWRCRGRFPTFSMDQTQACGTNAPIESLAGAPRGLGVSIHFGDSNMCAGSGAWIMPPPEWRTYCAQFYIIELILFAHQNQPRPFRLNFLPSWMLGSITRLAASRCTNSCSCAIFRQPQAFRM